MEPMKRLKDQNGNASNRTEVISVPFPTEMFDSLFCFAVTF